MKFSELAEKIAELFNNTEQRSLCFDLNIEYEFLSGENRKEKAIELVKYCKRHHKLDALLIHCKVLRPNESWPSVESLISTQPSFINDTQQNFRFWIIGAIVFVSLLFGLLNFFLFSLSSNVPTLSSTLIASSEEKILTSTPSFEPSLIDTLVPEPTTNTESLLSLTMTQPPSFAFDPTEIPLLSTADAATEQISIALSPSAYTPTTEIENGYTYVLIPAKTASDQTIEIQEFWIGKYEITNLWFAIYLNNINSGNKCSNGSFCIDTKIPNTRISRENSQWVIDEGYENHPVTGVTWYGANDYCQAIEGRLPDYAEWIHAASWNPITNESRLYPWGDHSPSPDLANYNNHKNDTQSVSSLPEGRTISGVFNMLGNVWEFVANTQGINRTAVGGGWDTPQNQLVIGTTYPATERTTSSSLGFRCAR